jgi:hypothetical protein
MFATTTLIFLLSYYGSMDFGWHSSSISKNTQQFTKLLCWSCSKKNIKSIVGALTTTAIGTTTRHSSSSTSQPFHNRATPPPSPEPPDPQTANRRRRFADMHPPSMLQAGVPEDNLVGRRPPRQTQPVGHIDYNSRNTQVRT